MARRRIFHDVTCFIYVIRIGKYVVQLIRYFEWIVWPFVIGWKIKAGAIDCYGIGKRLVSRPVQRL